MQSVLTKKDIYRLRSKVDIESAAEEFSCWQRYGGNLTENMSCVEEPEASGIGYGGNVNRSGISAVRGNNLGWRCYKDPRLECLGFRGIFLSNTTPPLVEADKETDEQNYLLWRLEKGVAEGSIEIPKELEQKVAPGSEVVVAASGKKAGIVTSALGSLRLEEAFKGSGTLIIQGQEDVNVEAIKPEW